MNLLNLILASINFVLMLATFGLALFYPEISDRALLYGLFSGINVVALVGLLNISAEKND